MTDVAASGAPPARPLRVLPGPFWTALSLGLFFAAWYAATEVFRVDPVFIPSIEMVARALIQGFGSGLFITHLGVTMAEILLGFLVAVAVGVGLGALISVSPIVERSVSPLIVAFQSMPKIAMAPLIIVWFGYGIASKVVLVAFVACFPILISTIAGLAQCDPGRLDVMQSLRASRLQLIWMVRLPSALPMIFAGIDVAAIFVVIGAIVGEFVGAKSGMGTLIIYANTNMDTAQVFAVLLVMAVVGLGFHRSVQWIRRRVVFWVAQDLAR